MYLPTITENMEPPKIVKKWALAAKALPSGTEDKEAIFIERAAGVEALGGTRRRSFARCGECGLRYHFGEGHRSSAFCAMMQTIIWAYASGLFPTTRKAETVLKDGNVRHLWLPTIPEARRLVWSEERQRGVPAKFYRDVAFLRLGLWADAGAVFWLWNQDRDTSESTLTVKLLGGARIDPLKKSNRLWNQEVARVFGQRFKSVRKSPPPIDPTLLIEPRAER